MKRLVILLTLQLLLVYSAIAKQDKKQITACFEQYKTAILSEDAELALKCLDSNTIAYYSNIASLSRTATRDGIDTLPIMSKLLVIVVRHRIPKPELLKMNGKELILYAVKNGMLGDKTSIDQTTITKISIDDNKATALFKDGKQVSDNYFRFNKETEGWKLDMTSISGVVSKSFNRVISQSGLTENDFIFRLAEASSGRRIDDTIWEPIAEK
ncbi:MAG: hypothetical protein EOP56_17695 [Sphingobacteriales bacterium]|nr:MAG: hypothetical protein EOP56_17695 [Sphingobacteriales bacterium]